MTTKVLVLEARSKVAKLLEIYAPRAQGQALRASLHLAIDKLVEAEIDDALVLFGATRADLDALREMAAASDAQANAQLDLTAAPVVVENASQPLGTVSVGTVDGVATETTIGTAPENTPPIAGDDQLAPATAFTSVPDAPTTPADAEHKPKGTRSRK